MKIVPFPGSVGGSSEGPPGIIITEANEPIYRELFQAVHLAMTTQPWESLPGGILFSIPDEMGASAWEAEVSGREGGLCLFRLTNSHPPGDVEDIVQLEVQFASSELIQGDDYELNVRFAPEEWDELERDVILLRRRSEGEESRHPDEEELHLLCDGLRLLNVKHLNDNEFRIL